MDMYQPPVQEMFIIAQTATSVCALSKKEQPEQTLAIIKPDAVAKNQVEPIICYILKGGLKVVSQNELKLTREQVEGFYAVHKERPFFNELVDFMSSGEVVVLVIQGDDAVSKWRQIMGSTNPAKADAGTIRRDFGTDVMRNAVHGSDSKDNAQKEITYFTKS